MDTQHHVEANALAKRENCWQKPCPEHHEEGQEKDSEQHDREYERPTALTHHSQDEHSIMHSTGNEPPFSQRTHPSKRANWNQQPLKCENQTGCHKQDAHMSPNLRSQPPTRKPPPPQANPPSRGAEWNQQPLVYEKQNSLHHEQDEQNKMKMSANQVRGPPTRKPPPLPQTNHSIRGAEWNQQPSLYGNQKKQVQEEMGAYENDNAKQPYKRITPLARPSPPLVVRATDREQLGVQARTLPDELRRQQPSFFAPANSDPHNAGHKPPCPSPKSQVLVSTSSPINSRTGDAPKTPTKLPHVDDIAANLEALRQARLRGPRVFC
ncbi:hypothetical protein L7F22_021518 [Adiantum nelumboides]|nr:hypothetical protein [Adiantum nelumboides]